MFEIENVKPEVTCKKKERNNPKQEKSKQHRKVSKCNKKNKTESKQQQIENGKKIKLNRPISSNKLSSSYLYTLKHKHTHTHKYEYTSCGNGEHVRKCNLKVVGVRVCVCRQANKFGRLSDDGRSEGPLFAHLLIMASSRSHHEPLTQKRGRKKRNVNAEEENERNLG